MLQQKILDFLNEDVMQIIGNLIAHSLVENYREFVEFSRSRRKKSDEVTISMAFLSLSFVMISHFFSPAEQILQKK